MSKQRKNAGDNVFNRLDAALDRFERNLLIDFTIVLASITTIAVIAIKW